MHPNASAAVYTTAASGLLLYVLHRFGYAHITAQDAQLATGALITLVLWVGKRGIRAAVLSLWRGSQPQPKETP